MEKVLIIRHGIRDADSGKLTSEGVRDAYDLGSRLPKIVYALASGTIRAKQTAKLVSGLEPRIDARAGFLAEAEDESQAIGQYALEHSIDFITAARQYNGGALAAGIADQATQLDGLIDEMLADTSVEGTGLIVTHGLTIASALALRGLQERLPGYLSGYWVFNDGAAEVFTA